MYCSWRQWTGKPSAAANIYLLQMLKPGNHSAAVVQRWPEDLKKNQQLNNCLSLFFFFLMEISVTGNQILKWTLEAKHRCTKTAKAPEQLMARGRGQKSMENRQFTSATDLP